MTKFRNIGNEFFQFRDCQLFSKRENQNNKMNAKAKTNKPILNDF